jgi:crotonobetainyl-CoA:carnitine CoA-transferase CaiB-like acyl-CoA transferase
VLEGIRVVELASDRAAYTGKLLADMGADVVVVEPPGGHASRRYGPFVDDEPDPDRCLWWWHYNTSKRSVVLDLETASGREAFRQLALQADVVLEAEDPGHLDALGIDHEQVRAERPELIWVSVTPFGRRCAELDAPMTDLTILAAGGVVWNCGYDDHTIAPVRPGGGQAQHIAGVFAACGALVAVLHRDGTGRGQHVDVSMVAAANVTTESGSVMWLVANTPIARQTGRHAAPMVTIETQVLAADGRYVTTGFPPHSADDFQRVVDWLEDLGLADEFVETFFLRMGVERGGVHFQDLGSDAEATAIYAAGREAVCFIASKLPAHEFFVAAQGRDLQCGVVYAPEEAIGDAHIVERGFPVVVEHPELGRQITYPGAFFRDPDQHWRIRRRPPLVGEHTDEVLGSGLAGAAPGSDENPTGKI